MLSEKACRYFHQYYKVGVGLPEALGTVSNWAVLCGRNPANRHWGQGPQVNKASLMRAFS